MQIQVFTISMFPTEPQMEELNHFLRSHKIIEVRKELALNNGIGVWTFCITYLVDSAPAESKITSVDKSKRVDYKDILQPIQFERFVKMRKLRKQIADSEAIPAYAIFTDAELSEMAKLDVLSLAEINKISGIGKKKIERYALRFTEIDNIEFDEKSGIPY